MEVFQKILKEINYEFGAYFWKCPPVSKKTLNNPFEFVAIKSEALNILNNKQYSDPFVNHIIDVIDSEKQVGSFLI